MWRLVILGFASVVSAVQAPMEAYSMEQQQAEETQNMDPNFLLAMGQQIQLTVAQSLQNHQLEFDKKFANLERMCEEGGNSIEGRYELIPDEMESKVEEMVEKFVDQLLRFSETAIETVEEKMVAVLENALSDIDDKLQPVNEEITDIKNQMAMLVTQDEVADLQTKLTALTTDAVTEIKSEVANLPTIQELHNQTYQLGDGLLEVTYLIGNLTTCSEGSSETVQQLLKQLQESDQEMGELSEFVMDSSSQNFQCASTFEDIVQHLENLTVLVKGNNEALTDLGDTLGNMQETFGTRLEDLENVAQTIVEGQQTTTEKSTTTTTTETPIPTSPPPCLDSNFVGAGRSLDVCSAAVRFRKCHLQFVAFHCCRSCTDSGLISTIPNYSGPRTVPVLQALKSLRPN